MSTVDRVAGIYDDMRSALDDRTLEILEHRRRTATIKRRGWLVRRALLAADLVGLLIAFFAVELSFGGSSGSPDAVGETTEVMLFFSTLPAWIVVAKLYGLYERDEERTDHTTADDLLAVFHMVTVGTWLTYAFAFVTGLARPTVPKLLVFWALAICVVTLSRGLARVCVRRSLTYLQNTIIVGAGDVGQLVARKLLKHPEYGINLVGFADAEPKKRGEDLEHLTVLGSPERVPALVRLFDIERVVIAFSNESHEQTLDLVRALNELDVQVDIVPRLFEIVGSSAGVHTVEGLPLVGMPPLRLSRSSRLLKRALDLAVSAVALVLLAPLFAAIAFLIKRGSQGPVFFRQVRMGADDETFRIYKFRTMSADADARKADVAHLNMHLDADPRMFKIPNDPRITKVGAVLRRLSLDELPQLINVLRGDMSLVGPRPLILDEDQFIETWGRRRLDLKPGVTGPWQVLGRNHIPFEEMVRLDYLYVTGWSLYGDLKLILRTLPAIARGRSAY